MTSSCVRPSVDSVRSLELRVSMTDEDDPVFDEQVLRKRPYIDPA